MRWLVLLVAISACGKSGDSRDKPSPAPTPVATAPVVTPDAAPAPTPVAPPMPTAEGRARAALEEAAAVLVAFTTATGKERCNAKKEIEAAVAANAEHIKHVHDVLNDPVVKPFVQTIDVPAFKAALRQWQMTQIDGTCKIDADITAFQDMVLR